jgi:peptide/nickel transport system permease protein
MATFIVRRLLISVPVFFGITVLVFLFVAIAPGDAASALIRPDQAADPAIRQAIVERYGLDQPIPIRYVRWLSSTLQGELGYTVVSGRPIAGEIGRSFLASLLLVGTALVGGILVGVPLGVLSAVRQYSKLDFTLTGITFLGISMPSFLLGIGGLWLVGLQLGLVPIAGMVTPGQPFDLFDLLRHLVLPASILAFAFAAQFMRYTRASMLEVVNADYVTTARAKGLPSRTVITRHAFRNAMIPVITLIGLYIPEMIGGAVVLEQVFSWPGLGQLAVNSVVSRDFNLIMGITMVLSVFVLVANLLTDLAYGFADPRIRLS